MIDKRDVFKMGELIRDAEKALDKLHKFAHKKAVQYSDELGLNESEGDFTTMSGGTNKPPTKPGG